MLLYVGRFTAVKRVPLLIEAYSAGAASASRGAPRSCWWAASRTSSRASTPTRRSSARARRTCILAGWHEHAALPRFLNAADVVVLPSVAEQFGQVLVEGMACGLPVIAVDSHGPAEIVDHGGDRLAGAPATTRRARRRAGGGGQRPRASAAGAASAPARSRSSATPGPRSPSGCAAVYETALRGD